MKQREKEVLKLIEDFKDTLENDLINQQMENKKIKIKDVKYVGQALSENVFIVEKETIEIDEVGDERITEQENYYLGDECIGGTIGDHDVVFSENFQETEPEKVKAVNELLETTSEEEIEANSYSNLHKKEIAEVLTAHLGRKITDAEAEKIMQEMDENEIEELKEDREELDKKDENGLSEKQAENVKVRGIQKVYLNELVDGRETLGKRLDLEEYDSMYVIYADDVDEITADSKINSTTYSLVGIKNNGEAEVLDDEFEMDRTVGNSATKEQTKIRADGTVTRDNQDLSVYTRKSNGASVGIENTKGTVNMFLYQKTLEQNENVGIQIETSQTPIIPIETREVMNRYKGMYQTDKVQDEVEEHTENECEPEDVKDYDGIEETQSHEHLSEDIDEYVQEIYNYENEYGEEKIREVFTEDEVRDKFLRELEENKDNLSVEQIVENVKEEMNSDAEMIERDHKM